MPECIPSIFNVTDPTPCGIFAPTDGYGADQWLSFFRSTLKLSPELVQPYLNSAGETVLSFVSFARYLGSLQPMATNVARLIQGQVVQVNYRFIVTGYADVQELDRCVIEGRRVEVVNAQHYGDESTEIDLRHIGR